MNFIPRLTAQDRKLVTGRILDMATDLPIDLSQVEVVVYSFNTIAEAEDVKKQMDEDANAVILPEAVTYPDQNGYYQIYVASTGALVFKADMQDAVVEHVDNRLEIDVKLSLGNRIRNSLISAKRENIGVMEPESDIDGNWLKARSTISLPEFAGKANARLIILESFPYGFACPKMEKSTLVRSPVTISNERLGVITAYMAALALTARSWAEAFSARSRDIAAITADNKRVFEYLRFIIADF